MDILIKNMEMPKACCWYDENHKYHECKLMKMCEQRMMYSTAQRPADCPCIQLPEHGRLVDYDKFEAWLHRMNGGREHFILDEIKMIEYFIEKHAPTILEAST